MLQFIFIFRNYTFVVVLYHFETGFLTREEHKLRVFKNKVLRKIFVIQREEVAGDSRQLHNVELCDCTSHQIGLLIIGVKIEKNEMGGACNSFVYRVLVLKPEGKRQFARRRHKCDYNIKTERGRLGGCGLG
jgi:hypothetical protein